MEEPQVLGLLIEDDPVDQVMITRLAGRDGARWIDFDLVDNLTEGTRRLSENPTRYSVILLDLGLPEASGLDTLQKLLALEVPAPVIVLTGFTDESLGQRSIRAGAEDYLCKGSVNAEILSRSVHYAVERSKLRGELELARAR